MSTFFTMCFMGLPSPLMTGRSTLPTAGLINFLCLGKRQRSEDEKLVDEPVGCRMFCGRIR